MQEEFETPLSYWTLYTNPIRTLMILQVEDSTQQLCGKWRSVAELTASRKQSCSTPPPPSSAAGRQTATLSAPPSPRLASPRRLPRFTLYFIFHKLFTVFWRRFHTIMTLIFPLVNGRQTKYGERARGEVGDLLVRTAVVRCKSGSVESGILV